MEYMREKSKRRIVVCQCMDLSFVKVLREVRCQSWGILVSHPFQGRIEFLIV